MPDAVGPPLEKYKIDRQLSTGGMGTVYLATDTTLHRQVAIKVLTPEWAGDPERFQRFQWEAQVLASLNHPNIVTIYSVEEENDVHFLTMELVEGKTLAELIPSVGLRLDRIFELAIPLADALNAAHQRGIIHRDLKPGNIMVGKDGRVKILDFGLAKQRDDMLLPEDRNPGVDQPITRDGQMLGTVPYMSPEQVHGETVDHRTDIFSLGIILYEMATGHRPFQGKTWGDLASAILRDEPPSVTMLNLNLPRHLGRIIRHCLEKEPERRFQTALDLRNELEELRREVQTGEISASPEEIRNLLPSGQRQAYKRRFDGERLLAVGASAVVILFVAVMGWMRWGRTLDLPPPEPIPVSPPATAEETPRIVVLPLENLGPTEQEYFAAGITEEITSRLASVRALHVISRTTALSYDRTDKTVLRIGEELGVDYLLEGSVRWSSGSSGIQRVRVTPKLIRVADDTHIWSESYDRVLDDLIAVQSEIAEQVIDELGVALLEPEKEALATLSTDNPEAYRAYIRGLDLANRGDPDKNWKLAVQELQLAVELDPEFAQAWAELSEVHSQVYHLVIDRSEERLQKAQAAVDRALEIDPELPAAHRAKGYFYFWGHRDFEAALLAFDTAASALPNDSQLREGIAYIRRRQGRFDEAVEELSRALDLDPQSARLALELASTKTTMGRYAEAEALYDRAIALDPAQKETYRAKATNVLLWQGDLRRAREVLERMPKPLDLAGILAWYEQELREGSYQAALDRIDMLPTRVAGTATAMMPKHLLRAGVYRRMGREAEARAEYEATRAMMVRIAKLAAEDPRRRVPLAYAYAGLGNRKDALLHAGRAVELEPVARNADHGPGYLEHQAVVYMMLGMQEEAVAILERLLAMPSKLSVVLLRVDPRWDPLRQNPRFASLVETDAEVVMSAVGG